MFLVGMDSGTEDDPHWRDPIPPLKADTLYGGNLLDGEVGQTQYVEYDAVGWAKYKGSELEEVPGDYRLLDLRIGKG